MCEDKPPLEGTTDIEDVISAFEVRADDEINDCDHECMDCADVSDCIVGIRHAIGDLCGVIVVLYKKIQDMAKPMNTIYESLKKDKKDDKRVGEIYT